jgi:hypothetical protein
VAIKPGLEERRRPRRPEALASVDRGDDHGLAPTADLAPRTHSRAQRINGPQHGRLIEDEVRGPELPVARPPPRDGARIRLTSCKLPSSTGDEEVGLGLASGCTDEHLARLAVPAGVAQQAPGIGHAP